MKNYLIIFIILILSSITLAFRCDEEIVGRWDTTAEVINKCGQPHNKEYTNEKINGTNQYVEKWYYNCGENDFIYSLTIVNGKVYRDDPVQRGTGKSQCHTPK